MTIEEYASYKPCSIGTSWPIMVRPPDPKYCPAATSWKNMGMPQANMAMKYMSKNVPVKRKNTSIVRPPWTHLEFSLVVRLFFPSVNIENSFYIRSPSHA